MAWGDEERCEDCGEVWVEPSKNSVKKSFGGMHQFMASHGIRRTPDGYEQANLMIDDIIDQKRENFRIEHQNCRYSEGNEDMYPVVRCQRCGGYRCVGCGEHWVKPSKNSIVKSSGGMHNFMRSYGLKGVPGGYQEAKVIIERMIAQDREEFIQEHQYCHPYPRASSPSSSSSRAQEAFRELTHTGYYY